MLILTIDQRRRCAILDNREIRLTPQEYRVLNCLGRQLGEVVPKEALLAAMWGVKEQEDTLDQANPMAVDLVIFRLRKKLSDSAQSPRYLETRRGFGYILHNTQFVFWDRVQTCTESTQRMVMGAMLPVLIPFLHLSNALHLPLSQSNYLTASNNGQR